MAHTPESRLLAKKVASLEGKLERMKNKMEQWEQHMEDLCGSAHDHVKLMSEIDLLYNERSDRVRWLETTLHGQTN